MISDALGAPLSDEECVKSCFLYSSLVSGYALELICEAIRDFLRRLSCRVRKKYKAIGATRAITTIGTTIAGMRLGGMPWAGGEDVSAGGDVWAGEAVEVFVEDEEVGRGKEASVVSDSRPLKVEVVVVVVELDVPAGGKIKSGKLDSSSCRFLPRRIVTIY